MQENETMFQFVWRKTIYIIGACLAIITSMVLYTIFDAPLTAMMGGRNFAALFAVHIVALIFGLNYFNKWLAR